jgi:hypothetical protein
VNCCKQNKTSSLHFHDDKAESVVPHPFPEKWSSARANSAGTGRTGRTFEGAEKMILTYHGLVEVL